jgi:hypothetical protein
MGWVPMCHKPPNRLHTHQNHTPLTLGVHDLKLPLKKGLEKPVVGGRFDSTALHASISAA